MVSLIALLLLWFVGGVAGYRFAKFLVQGFPSRIAVETTAIIWGLTIAVLVRGLILWISEATWSTVAFYVVGLIVATPYPHMSFHIDNVRMHFDYVYFKQQILATIPGGVYIVISAILYFLWD